jgi:hypothetical protein
MDDPYRNAQKLGLFLSNLASLRYGEKGISNKLIQLRVRIEPFRFI